MVKNFHLKIISTFFAFSREITLHLTKKKHKYEIDFQKKKNCFGLYFFGKEVKFTQYIYYEFVHLTFEV